MTVIATDSARKLAVDSPSTPSSVKKSSSRSLLSLFSTPDKKAKKEGEDTPKKKDKDKEKEREKDKHRDKDKDKSKDDEKHKEKKIKKEKVKESEGVDKDKKKHRDREKDTGKDKDKDKDRGAEKKTKRKDTASPVSSPKLKRSGGVAKAEKSASKSPSTRTLNALLLDTVTISNKEVIEVCCYSNVKRAFIPCRSKLSPNIL